MAVFKHSNKKSQMDFEKQGTAWFLICTVECDQITAVEMAGAKGGMCNAYDILVRKSECKRSHGRPGDGQKNVKGSQRSSVCVCVCVVAGSDSSHSEKKVAG